MPCSQPPESRLFFDMIQAKHTAVLGPNLLVSNPREDVLGAGGRGRAGRPRREDDWTSKPLRSTSEGTGHASQWGHKAVQ